MVQGYYAYILDRDGHVETRHDLFCISDDDARRQAECLVDGQPVELWQETRRVAIFHPKEARVSGSE